MTLLPPLDAVGVLVCVGDQVRGHYAGLYPHAKGRVAKTDGCLIWVDDLAQGPIRSEAREWLVQR